LPNDSGRMTWDDDLADEERVEDDSDDDLLAWPACGQTVHEDPPKSLSSFVRPNYTHPRYLQASATRARATM
jgi:hypothetical protein